jgi:hypothetical protein
MAIIVVPETLYEEIGASLAGAVVTVNGNLRVDKIPVQGEMKSDTLTHSLIAFYDVYVNQAAYDSHKNPIITSKQYGIQITYAQSQTDLFKIVYDGLKVLFPGATDYQPDVAAVPPPA